MVKRHFGKGLRYYIPFWIVPALAPLAVLIHLSIVINDTEVTHEGTFAVLAIVIAVSSFSFLGCAVDGACTWPRTFPIEFMIVQLLLLFFGIIAVRQLVAHNELRTRVHTVAVPNPPVNGALRQQMNDQIQAAVLSKAEALNVPGPPGAAAAAVQLIAEKAAVAQTSKDTIISQPASDYPAEAPKAQDEQSGGAQFGLPDDASNTETTTTLEKFEWPSEILNSVTKVTAWKDAGDGYCEDGNTHKEFNSLHTKPKTLQECADVGIADPGAIALDFSHTDGGCDLRYPAGVLAIDQPGFEWYAWGGGEGEPTASGKQKHETETRCYLMEKSAQNGAEKAVHALSTELHPYLHSLIREYSFNPVRTEQGEMVNIILVHAPFQNKKEEEYYEKFKDEILFIGISSLEDFPLPPPNPFSPKFPRDKYVGLFPGFLNMFRDPQDIYPSHVKVLDMSQSDFSLPPAGQPLSKVYDFTFSGSDQDIGADMVSECKGWSMFCKNWSFAKQALEVMCGEFGLTGVLVATKDKEGKKRCGIPKSCEGKVLQTSYLDQASFFTYVKQSRFLFLPNVHDASPRVATQALALDVPLLMNWNLIGGWKYVNEKTGEFFHDLSDFRANLKKLLENSKAGGVYTPEAFVNANYGDMNAGATLKAWVEENFQDRVLLPAGTQLLLPSS